MNLPDPEYFSFKEGEVAGDECILITPSNIKCKWSEETLKFRSLLIRKSDHKIISRGYDKFFNYGEQPDLDVFPDGPFDVIEKKDGSLIIWGVYKDVLIHRTRGTFDASNMPNGHEIEFLKKKYLQLIVAIFNNRQYSFLTEWQTKTNIIVVNEVDEPTLNLIGVINNETGELIPQKELDKIAEVWGLARPVRYHYNSLAECVADVDLWRNKEGVVVYSEDGQHLRKCKSEWYRALHALATGIKTPKHVMELFLASPKFTSGDEFYKYVETTLDYEIAEKIKPEINIVVQAYNNYLVKVDKIIELVDSFRFVETRKECAMLITSRYKDWRAGCSFTLLDNREISDKILSNAVFQELSALTNI
jgi:T4 RnlA family RNA ligase